LKRSIVPLGVAIAILIGRGVASADDPPVEAPKVDLVVLIGGTMIERDQEYGYLETRLSRWHPDRPIAFRNLGWSGDTVEGPSRAGFGSKADGFKHLVDHVLALKPTRIIIGYGAVEAFDGPGGLPAFQANLERLVKALEPAGARLYFLAPNRQEDLGPPLPDPSAHNADLALYRDAIRARVRYLNKNGNMAQRLTTVFVDLFDLLPDGAKANPRLPLTDNGLHFNAYGSWRMAEAIDGLMGLHPAHWDVMVDRLGLTQDKTISMANFNSQVIEQPHTIPGGIRFALRSQELPTPLAPDPRVEITTDDSRLVRFRNLEPGRYVLKVDGKPLAQGDADAWKAGLTIKNHPDYDQVEALRQAIIAKNQLYFYRWRPQNETYLFGFRKHEQGQNAREIPQFDPLVATKEAEIARLRVPSPHTYELIREGEVVK
jgi:lysophospholipase L1-like esterase